MREGFVYLICVGHFFLSMSHHIKWVMFFWGESSQELLNEEVDDILIEK